MVVHGYDKSAMRRLLNLLFTHLVTKMCAD